MKDKARNILIAFFLALSGYGGVVYAEQPYQEKIFSGGKVIYGIKEAEALNKYGTPTAVEENIWFYDGAQKIYVYMEDPVEVYLYPRFLKGYVDSPLELKILAGSRAINDVTTQSELLLSDPEAFSIIGKGVLMPKKPGEYQVIAVYKDKHSNASFISIAEPEKESANEEQLVALDIFPYKPYVNPNTSVYFYAFGTFLFKGNYTVRELTRQVEWFRDQDGQTVKLSDSRVIFSVPGKFKVFCKYKGMQSMPQDVEVARDTEYLSRYLKQISILPADVTVSGETSISFYAFASYGDNSMEEVTKKIGWGIKDNAILEREADNVFLAASAGVTELQGVLDNLRSLAAKVRVSSSPVNKKQADKEKSKKQKVSPKDLLEEIQNDIKDLDKKVAEEKKIKRIKIVPDYCSIPAGAQKQLSAFAVAQDNSEEDITVLGKWKTLDTGVAGVNSGLVNAIRPGETKVCVQYKNIENQCVSVLVEEAKLVSIVISPQQPQIAKGEYLDLKAEGYFGDSAHKDITFLARWTSENPNIVRMDKNRVFPLRVGQAKIFAEYSGIRSLPAAVEVVEEKYWLLKMIIKIIFFTVLLLFLIYSYFYIMVEKKKRHILSLYPDPRDFTVALYRNLKSVISIFGVRYKFYTPPLFLAGLLEEKYPVKDNLFLKFTQQYEEAKYSSHAFPPETSRMLLETYNTILQTILSRQKRGIRIYRYLQVLLSGVPLLIHK